MFCGFIPRDSHTFFFFQIMDPTKVVGWYNHPYEEVEEGEIVGTVPQLVNKLKDTRQSIIKTMPQLVLQPVDITNFFNVLTDTIISLDKATPMTTDAAAAAAAAAMPKIQNKMDDIIINIKQLQHQLTVSNTTAVGNNNNNNNISIISLSLSLSKATD